MVCFLLFAFEPRGAQRRLVYQNSRLQGPPRTIFTKFIARTVPYDFMGLALDDIRLATFRSENCDHFVENGMPSVRNSTLRESNGYICQSSKLQRFNATTEEYVRRTHKGFDTPGSCRGRVIICHLYLFHNKCIHKTNLYILFLIRLGPRALCVHCGPDRQVQRSWETGQPVG